MSETEGLTAQVRSRIRHDMLRLVALRNSQQAQRTIMEHVDTVTQYVMDRVQVDDLKIVPGDDPYDSTMTIQVKLPFPNALPCICHCGETLRFDDLQIHLNEVHRGEN